MKVVLVNGSPRAKGCTYTALTEVEKVLQQNGIKTEIFQVGAKAVQGCIACGKCLKTGKCIVDDIVNEFLSKVSETDGFVFGSPVHYAAASGALTSFMDRAFYGKARLYKGKLGAAVVSCRREEARQPSIRSINILPSVKCPLYPPSIGTWYTGIRRRKS